VTPEATWEGEALRIGKRLQATVREAGEPWLSLFTPDEFAGVLADSGFAIVEDLGLEDIHARYDLEAVNYERISLAKKVAA
jgi:O-methyltransferase involved in polyketide biosynthesis